MIIKIDIDVLNSSEINHLREIDRILFSVDDNWHDWITSDPDAVESSEWWRHTSTFRQNDFKKIAVASIWSRARNVRTVQIV